MKKFKCLEIKNNNVYNIVIYYDEKNEYGLMNAIETYLGDLSNHKHLTNSLIAIYNDVNCIDRYIVCNSHFTDETNNDFYETTDEDKHLLLNLLNLRV